MYGISHHQVPYTILQSVMIAAGVFSSPRSRFGGCSPPRIIIALILIGITVIIFLGISLRSTSRSEGYLSDWRIPETKSIGLRIHNSGILSRDDSSAIVLNAGTGSVPKAGLIYDSLSLATASHPSVVEALLAGTNETVGFLPNEAKTIGLFSMDCIHSQIKYASNQEYRFVLNRKPFIRTEDRRDPNAHSRHPANEENHNLDEELIMFLVPLLSEELQKPMKERVGWIFWIPAESYFMNTNVPLHIFLPPEDFPYVNIIGPVDNAGVLCKNSIIGFRVHIDSVKFLVAAWSNSMGKASPNEAILSPLLKQSQVRKWRNMFITVPNRWFASLSPSQTGNPNSRKRNTAQRNEEGNSPTFRPGDLVVNLNDDSVENINQTLSDSITYPERYSLPLAKISFPKPADFWQEQRKLRRDSKLAMQRTYSRYDELTAKAKDDGSSIATKKEKWDSLVMLMDEIRAGGFKHATDAALAKELLDDMEEILKGNSETEHLRKSTEDLKNENARLQDQIKVLQNGQDKNNNTGTSENEHTKEINEADSSLKFALPPQQGD